VVVLGGTIQLLLPNTPLDIVKAGGVGKSALTGERH